MNRKTKSNIKTAIIIIIAITLLSIAIVTRNIKSKNYTSKSNETYRQITTTTVVNKETTTDKITELSTNGSTNQNKTVLAESSVFYTTETKTPEKAVVLNSTAFYYDDDEPVYISAEEYYTICGIVMNEAGADYGSYEGRVAVAQCIRNQIIREKKCGHAYDITTIREVYKLHYTKKPSNDVRKAVTDVFYNHIVVTKEPIIAWCAGYSEWHSNFAIYVCSYSGNDFYKLSDSVYLY